MEKSSLRLNNFLFVLYLFTITSLVLFVKNKLLTIYIPSYTDIVFFALLVGLTESFVVPFKNMSVSTSFAVQLATFILFGSFAAIIITICGFSIRVVRFNNRYVHIFNTPIYQTLYNYCIIILPILYGNLIYTLFHVNLLDYNMWSNIYVMLFYCIAVFAINTFITSVLFSILNKKSILYFFIANAKLGILSSLVMAPFGLILSYIFKEYRFGGVLLMLCPIVLARYTFSLYIQSKNQYIQTVDTLMRAMEARDKYTEGHSQRVAEIATMIARELRYSDLKIEQITMASMLHDVGKIGIDDSILNKPGKLTNEEYEIIKSHPNIGYNILKDIKNLENILPIVKYHHERYDGKGYPEGKKAEELELDVFIIQLADSIDAMATDRPYRKALTKEQIHSEIVKYSGMQFHPKVVEAYLNILEKQKKAV